MTTTEMLLRLIAALACWLISAALAASVLAERHGLVAAVLLIAAGPTVIGVAWSYTHAEGDGR